MRLSGQTEVIKVDMVDKVDEKNSKWENGVRITWDTHGNAFVNMPVNNIPKKQFDDWLKICKFEYSGKRWDMILADRLKAQAYDALLMTIPEEKDMPEQKEDVNPLGLMSGGKD